VNTSDRPSCAALSRRAALLGAAGLVAACGGHNWALGGPARGSALSAPSHEASWIGLQCDDPLGTLPGPIHLKVSGGTERDLGFACAAMRRVLEFFAGHGLTPDRRLRIEFKASVFLDLRRPMHRARADPTPSNGPPAHAERIVGMFHRDRRTVLMTTEASPWIRSYTYFGLPMSDEMFTAMLTHEISHALSKSLYAPPLLDPDADIRVQQEYVAFVVQLSTMDARLRADSLARFPASTHRFTSEADINAWALGLGPEAFGVKSYRHFADDGGGSVFLRRLFDGDFRPPKWLRYVY